MTDSNGREAIRTTEQVAEIGGKTVIESTKTTIDAVLLAKKLAKSAIDGVLEAMRQKGAGSDSEIIIKQGSKNIYKGKIDGTGQRAKLPLEQEMNLSKTLSSPLISEGTIRITVDKTDQFVSSWGNVTTDKLGISGIAQQPLKQGRSLNSQQEKPQQSPQLPKFTQDQRPQLSVPPKLEVQAQPPQVLETPKERLGVAINGPTASEQRLMAKIEQLQGKVAGLQEQVSKLESLKSQPAQTKPRINDKVNNWVNKQRNRVASQLYKFGDKIATQSEHHVKQGLERQSQAFTAVKAGLETTINQSFDGAIKSLETARNQTLNGSIGVVDKIQGQADSANSQLLGKAEQSVTKLVNTLGKDSQVKFAPNGDRTVESRDYAFKIKADGGADISRKQDGSKVDPSNMTPKDKKVLSEMSKDIEQKLKPAIKQEAEQRPKQKLGR